MRNVGTNERTSLEVSQAFVKEEDSARISCTYAHRHPWLFALYDRHGWWKCRYCLEKISVRTSCTSSHRRPWLFVTYDRHGWWKCRYCLEQISVRSSLSIRAPPSLALCAIPYILYIKKSQPSMVGSNGYCTMKKTVRSHSLHVHILQ
jgi:hypothetical protein